MRRWEVGQRAAPGLFNYAMQIRDSRAFYRDLPDALLTFVVLQDGCWGWAGPLSNGYGHVGTHGLSRGAHRVSWETFRGPIPPGLLVCHTCDNPSCTRPSHLFVGSYAANTDDAGRKGRLRYGANAPHRLRNW